MGKVSNFPKQQHSDEIDVIQVSKDKIMINGVECETMELDEFIMNMGISPEAEERFIRGLFGIIKDACFEDFRLLKIFKEIFKGR